MDMDTEPTKLFAALEQPENENKQVAETETTETSCQMRQIEASATNGKRCLMEPYHYPVIGKGCHLGEEKEEKETELPEQQDGVISDAKELPNNSADIILGQAVLNNGTPEVIFSGLTQEQYASILGLMPNIHFHGSSEGSCAVDHQHEFGFTNQKQPKFYSRVIRRAHGHPDDSITVVFDEHSTNDEFKTNSTSGGSDESSFSQPNNGTGNWGYQENGQTRTESMGDNRFTSNIVPPPRPTPDEGHIFKKMRLTCPTTGLHSLVNGRTLPLKNFVMRHGMFIPNPLYNGEAPSPREPIPSAAETATACESRDDVNGVGTQLARQASASNDSIEGIDTLVVQNAKSAPKPAKSTLRGGKRRNRRGHSKALGRTKKNTARRLKLISKPFISSARGNKDRIYPPTMYAPVKFGCVFIKRYAMEPLRIVLTVIDEFDQYERYAVDPNGEFLLLINYYRQKKRLTGAKVIMTMQNGNFIDETKTATDLGLRDGSKVHVISMQMESQHSKDWIFKFPILMSHLML